MLTSKALQFIIIHHFVWCVKHASRVNVHKNLVETTRVALLSLQLFPFSFLYLAPVRFHFPPQWYLCLSCRSQHKYVWALALLKKGVMFSDGKNWFPISSTMTASFPATQAIWPTLLRLLGAVDQGDSCLHLRPRSLRSEREWKRNVLSLHRCCLDQKLFPSFREFWIWTLFVNTNTSAFVFILQYILCTLNVSVCVWVMMFSFSFDMLFLFDLLKYISREILMV